MTAPIHPTAIVGEGAEIADDVCIGPYCVIGSNVSIGPGSRLESHVVVEGRTTIGARCHLFPFASIGHRPQDLKYHGEQSTLEIGDDTVLREYVTVQPGTEHGGMHTKVGRQCLLMASAHVAHDCTIGDGVILGNNVMIAGHCSVGDMVIVSGGSAAVQFVRIGDHAFVGGMTGVKDDVIPYGLVRGNPGFLRGLNVVGLKRRGFDKEAVHALRRAYRMIFSEEGTLAERVEDAKGMFADNETIQQMVAFIQMNSDRPLTLPPRTGDDE